MAKKQTKEYKSHPTSKKLSERLRQGNAEEKIRRKFRVSPLAHKKADSTPPAAFSETAHFPRQKIPRQ